MLRYISALLLLVCLVPAAQAQALQDLPSSWLGTLPFPGNSLRVLITFRQDSNGKLAATLKSIDQSPREFQATSVELKGDRLILLFPSVNGDYTGKVTPDSISGTWVQDGAPFPLKLKKVSVKETTALPRKSRAPADHRRTGQNLHMVQS